MNYYIERQISEEEINNALGITYTYDFNWEPSYNTEEIFYSGLDAIIVPDNFNGDY